MSNEEHNPLAGHEVDGITELDNQLPRWWVWLFWLCNIFAVVYLLYYHVFNMGPLQIGEYEAEMAAAQQAQAALAASRGPAEAVNFDEPSADPAILAKGKSIYGINCVACHAMDGQGLVGPNLTDDFWIHGGSFQEISHTIIEGVPEKGMISWKLVLKEDEIHAVASYVWSLHGTDVSASVPPAKPPEPESKEYKRPS
ncbi:MAG: c-type cytochrome [Kiritimatiellae bacterium]|nr:c-type cytochrome [Kiritimatiellia bacterium]MCO5068904.1 c-type cytochrome [Kiritimatiellia bacterium]